MEKVVPSSTRNTRSKKVSHTQEAGPSSGSKGNKKGKGKGKKLSKEKKTEKDEKKTEKDEKKIDKKVKAKSEKQEPRVEKRASGAQDADPGPSVESEAKRAKVEPEAPRGNDIEEFQKILKDYSDQSKDVNNKVFYEANIGGDFNVKLSKWLKNNKFYIQVRKPPAAGISLSADSFKSLKSAIIDIESILEVVEGK